MAIPYDASNLCLKYIHRGSNLNIFCSEMHNVKGHIVDVQFCGIIKKSVLDFREVLEMKEIPCPNLTGY